MFIIKGGSADFSNNLKLFYILIATLYSNMETIHNIIYIIYNKI